MFNDLDNSIKVSNKKGTNIDEPITEVVDSSSWNFNSFKGIEIKSKKHKRSRNKQSKLKNIQENNNETQENKDNQIIEIPREKTESQLQVAITNKGKFFAEKNNELKYAEKHPYIMKEEVLTKAESTLYFIMNKTFNSLLASIGKGIVIFPKIRMADIIEVSTPLKSRRDLFYKIAYKHIDYLICDRDTLGVVCAVELDDFYHNRSDKIDRDYFVDTTLRDCGIQIFRVNIPIKNVTPDSLDNISDYILEYYSPICPKCGKLMMSMRSRRSKSYGHRFYGCSGWKPDGSGCNFSIDIN